MRTGSCALIPVKSLDAVKARLAPILSPGQRRALVGAMLMDLLDACAGAAGVSQSVVISRDPAVQALAAEREVDAWAEPPGAGLNGAVNWAAHRAMALGASATLVITGDCPLTTAGDIDRILTAARRYAAVFVPSFDGTGTNAVARRPGDTPAIAFGPNSLARHRCLAREANIHAAIVECPSLALDIDTPEDLERLATADADTRSVSLARRWLATLHA